jgi:peptide/nickel transport system ATP-binding protein
MNEPSSTAVQVAAPGRAHLRNQPSLLRVENLVVEFPAGSGRVVHAVSDVSFDLLEGETLGLVGESGCGKSTTGRTIMQLIRATSGKVMFDGLELTSLEGEALRRIRPRLQMIFQDPISSLNPRRRVRDIVGEPLAIWGAGTSRDRQLKVREVLDAVGLDYETASHRRPHEFSGGQCQRISIARALALEPKVIICDEPVSALDVSVQAQILNLLEDMKRRYGLTVIFIAHDLAVVKNVSDRVAVMYLGKLCELAPVDELYGAPSHPYTAGLLASIPEADPSIRPGLLPDAVAGEPPSPISPPSGCRFRTRCPKAQERCAIEEPVMREIRPNHFVACHFPLEGERWDALVESNARARINGPIGVDGPVGMDVNGEGGPVAASEGPVVGEGSAGADANGAGA